MFVHSVSALCLSFSCTFFRFSPGTAAGHGQVYADCRPGFFGFYALRRCPTFAVVFPVFCVSLRSVGPPAIDTRLIECTSNQQSFVPTRFCQRPERVCVLSFFVQCFCLRDFQLSLPFSYSAPPRSKPEPQNQNLIGNNILGLLLSESFFSRIPKFLF